MLKHKIFWWRNVQEWKVEQIDGVVFAKKWDWDWIKHYERELLFFLNMPYDTECAKKWKNYGLYRFVGDVDVFPSDYTLKRAEQLFSYVLAEIKRGEKYFKILQLQK